MSKTSIKELALSLSEKHDLNKADAERFVASIFEVINDGLEDDKLAKVKGLGAFKIIGVAARKSVDVNTGEPIVIEGRNKISFTPDASMRDDVNKPFSQFETVVINDGVDFSSIDNDYGNGTETSSEKGSETKPQSITDNAYKAEEEAIKEDFIISVANAEASSTSTIEENNEPQTERNTEDTIVETENIVEEENITKKENTENETAEEDNNAEKEAVEEDTVEEAEDKEAEWKKAVEENSVEKENAKEEDAEKEPIAEENTTEEEPADKEDIPEEDFTKIKDLFDEDDYEWEMERRYRDDKEAHRNHVMKVFMITAAVIIVGCLCGGYYLFSQIQRRDSHIEMLEEQMRIVAQHQKKDNNTVNLTTQPVGAQAQDSIVSNADVEPEIPKQASQDNVDQETLQTNSRQKTSQADNNQKTLKADDKQAALQNQYDKDVRIRTGAYAIVGIKNTITVRPGQTMTGISRSTLGPGMECYLEAVNGGKREVKAGETINIPQLKLKKQLH